MEFTDKFNFNPVFPCNLFRILLYLFGKGLEEIGIIKDADPIQFHIREELKNCDQPIGVKTYYKE